MKNLGRLATWNEFSGASKLPHRLFLFFFFILFTPKALAGCDSCCLHYGAVVGAPHVAMCFYCCLHIRGKALCNKIRQTDFCHFSQQHTIWTFIVGTVARPILCVCVFALMGRIGRKAVQLFDLYLRKVAAASAVGAKIIIIISFHCTMFQEIGISYI